MSSHLARESVEFDRALGILARGMGTRKVDAELVDGFTNALRPFIGNVQFFEYDPCGSCNPKLLVRQKSVIQGLLRVRGAGCPYL